MEYVPAGHISAASPVHINPEGQGPQTVEPAGVSVFIGHGTGDSFGRPHEKPAGHKSQLVDELEIVKNPSGHCIQLDDPESENCPGKQGLQKLCPAEVNEPAGHLTGATLPTEQKKPAGQRVQFKEPGPLNVPARQETGSSAGLWHENPIIQCSAIKYKNEDNLKTFERLIKTRK